MLWEKEGRHLNKQGWTWIKQTPATKATTELEAVAAN